MPVWIYLLSLLYVCVCVCIWKSIIPAALRMYYMYKAVAASAAPAASHSSRMPCCFGPSLVRAFVSCQSRNNVFHCACQIRRYCRARGYDRIVSSLSMWTSYTYSIHAWPETCQKNWSEFSFAATNFYLSSQFECGVTVCLCLHYIQPSAFSKWINIISTHNNKNKQEKHRRPNTFVPSESLKINKLEIYWNSQWPKEVK